MRQESDSNISGKIRECFQRYVRDIAFDFKEAMALE